MSDMLFTRDELLCFVYLEAKIIAYAYASIAKAAMPCHVIKAQAR